MPRRAGRQQPLEALGELRVQHAVLVPSHSPKYFFIPAANSSSETLPSLSASRVSSNGLASWLPARGLGRRPGPESTRPERRPAEAHRIPAGTNPLLSRPAGRRPTPPASRRTSPRDAEHPAATRRTRTRRPPSGPPPPSVPGRSMPFVSRSTAVEVLAQLLGREHLLGQPPDLLAVGRLHLRHRQQPVDQLVLARVRVVMLRSASWSGVPTSAKPPNDRSRSHGMNTNLSVVGRQVQVVVVPEPEEAVEVGEQGVGGQEAEERVDVEVRADLLAELRVVGLVDQPRQLDQPLPLAVGPARSSACTASRTPPSRRRSAAARGCPPASAAAPCRP